MNEEKIIRNMRHMAWERAKGELRSMLHTFWDDNPNNEQLAEQIDNFIEQVEEEGLQE